MACSMCCPRVARGFLLVLAVLLVAAGISLVSKGDAALRVGAEEGEGGAAPVRIVPAPGARGRPVDLPRGDLLLVAFLKALADYEGETVLVAPGIDPEETIRLESSLKRLNAEDAKRLLEEQGFELSRVTYRGEQVYWVRRRLVRPRKRGAIVRIPSEEEGARGGLATESKRIRLYERTIARGKTYLLLFETDSRREAEEALSILEAAVGRR